MPKRGNEYVKDYNRYTEDEEKVIKVMRKMFNVKPFSKEYVEQDRKAFEEYKKTYAYKHACSCARKRLNK